MKLPTTSTLLLALARIVLAQQPDQQLSLPDNYDGPVPGWDFGGSALFGENKVTLTSLGKGSQQGSIWSRNRLPYTDWTVEMSLSVGGPTDPGGGFGFWYTSDDAQTVKDGGPIHGHRDNFDGFALLLDSDEDGQGTLRGHLNDGTEKYSLTSTPSDKAFSLCKISYRNTGNQFFIRVGYGQGSLIVDVNGQKCFETDKIQLPKDQFIGFSAASTDKPDSFTLHKVKVYPELLSSVAVHKPGSEQPAVPPAAPAAPAAPATEEKQIRNEPSYEEIVRKLGLTPEKLASLDKVEGAVNEMANVRKQLASIERRMGDIESLFSQLSSSHGDVKHEQKQQLTQEMEKLRKQMDAHISKTVTDHTNNVLGSLPDTVNQALSKGGPSIWVLFVAVICVQGVLLVGYNVYRTRRSYHAKIL